MMKRSRLAVLTALALANATVVGCAADKAQAPAEFKGEAQASPAADEPPPPPPAPEPTAMTMPTTMPTTTPTSTPTTVAPAPPAELSSGKAANLEPMARTRGDVDTDKEIAVSEAKRKAIAEAREKAKTDRAEPKKAPADVGLLVKDAPADVEEEDERKPDTGGTFVHAGTNPFIATATDPLSTFAVDVDTGSFSYARRFLRGGNLPPEAAVRVEEWVNAMHYDYAPPQKGSDAPFAVHIAGAPSPIAKDKHLVRVALKGKEVTRAERQATTLVFLVDVSGSMSDPDKLPLAKDALRMLVNQLREDDQVGLVTYAGATQVVLPLTAASNKSAIMAGIEALHSGGGTNMGSGMELAYREAQKGLGGGRSARVMVVSDGDANIGKTSHEEMLRAIKGYVSEGVMMSTVGLGTGNYNDHLMEQLADAGNGNYSYIDSLKTAEKVFVAGLTGTLEVIAQDVKIQVEWNNDTVARYRLLGYENRDIADADFRNDKKDAGEIGAGHTVTALYELELRPGVVERKSETLGTVRVRAKKPRGAKASEIAVAITPEALQASPTKLDDDAIAASAVALAAEILRGSPYAEGRTLSEAAELLMGAAVGRNADERKELAKELLLVEPRLAHR